MSNASEIQSLLLEIDSDSADKVKKVGLDAFTGVVLKTPVDTGRARGNWYLTIDSETQSTSLTRKQGEAMSDAGAKLGKAQDIPQQIVIQNNLEYIIPLENGHSSQAPAGMVALTQSEIGAKYGL